MTEEEAIAMKARLEAAEDARNRVRYLREALKAVRNGDVTALRFDLTEGKDPEIQYRDKNSAAATNGTERFNRVCWIHREEGIGVEFLKAAESILESRLHKAENEYQTA
jgi:hypothetical protein